MNASSIFLFAEEFRLRPITVVGTMSFCMIFEMKRVNEYSNSASLSVVSGRNSGQIVTHDETLNTSVRITVTQAENLFTL